MPRASFAYSLNSGDGHPRRRWRVLRQAGRQSDLLSAEHSAGPRQRHLRELQYLGAFGWRRRRHRCARRHQRHRSGVAAGPPDELQHRRAARVRRLLRGGVLRRQPRRLPPAPARCQPRQLRRSARQCGAAGGAACVDQLPASVQGLLRDSHAPERRRVELQLAAALRDQAPRQYSLHDVSYTLGKVITDASGNGDNDTAEAAGDRAYTRGPASFDRRHAFVGTFTYRAAVLLDRGDLSWQRSPAGGRSAARFACSPASTTRPRAIPRSATAGRTTPAPKSGSTTRNELRWFNTDAFTVPAEDAKGTATVGQILGPSFYQWDLSMRKNFRFGGHYVVSRRSSTCSTCSIA